MLTQIYEAADPEDARKMADIGIDHIGILVGPGDYPRELPLDPAREVAAAIPAPAKITTLFLSDDIDLIAEWAASLKAQVLHLGAHADKLLPADVATLKERLPDTAMMRSIPMTGDESVAIAKSYEGIADFLLLDSISPDGQFGAVGKTHDWSVSRRIVEEQTTPVVLAGGLKPENVAEAIRAVRPAGVDSFSQTNRGDGSYRKDFDRVRRFYEEAQAAL